MDARKRGDPASQPERAVRSRQNVDNPFEDASHDVSSTSEDLGASSRGARTRRSNSRSIIMARGAFSKGLDHFKQRELIQGNASSNGDLFQYLITPGDNSEVSKTSSSPIETSSSGFLDSQKASAFSPHNYDITRNQLQDSHSRGLSVSTNELDTYANDDFHTANEIPSQNRRGDTPPNIRMHDDYNQSPSYSVRGGTKAAKMGSPTIAEPRAHQVGQLPVLVAKGPGSNTTPNFTNSSIISFTNTVPYNAVVSSDNNAPQLRALSSSKAAALGSTKKKHKNRKFSPDATNVSAISENSLYSGLSDMHTGLFLSTYNGCQQSSTVRTNVAKSKAFPAELPPRPAQRDPLPIRVTAEARAQFTARKQEQRLAMERRLAEPHLVRRLPPNDKWSLEFLKRLSSNCWVAIGVTQFSILSTTACIGVMIGIKSASTQFSPTVISVPVIWWFVLSVLLMAAGGAAFVTMFVRRNVRQPQGFRRRVGSREIVDGSLGRNANADLEGGLHVPRSFEMLSGAHIPRQQAFSVFDTPQRVQPPLAGAVRPTLKKFQRGPTDHHGFTKIPVHGIGERSYFQPRMQNPEADNAGFIVASPTTPLTPLPQAVLNPTTPRHVNDFAANDYESPNDINRLPPIGLAITDAQAIAATPKAPLRRPIPERSTSARSRESLLVAAVHREQAMKSLLGESDVPETTLDITDIFQGDRVSIESAAPSQASVYSYMIPGPHPLYRGPTGLQHLPTSPSVSGMGSTIDLDMAIPPPMPPMPMPMPKLKRVETEGPLEKLEKSLSHASQQISTGQPSPLGLGHRPKILHKRVVGGKLKEYGSHDDNVEAGPSMAGSSSNNASRQRPHVTDPYQPSQFASGSPVSDMSPPHATDHYQRSQFASGSPVSDMSPGGTSTLENVDLADTPGSRNPYRDSMNAETLPATYYTGNGKGKGRAYD
ncbi:hypothetical protein NHQ30_010664 [Ciborinia camelliae]|nr:hypothetical protein NHQ30_010664 [Ciborinia camelliae]